MILAVDVSASQGIGTRQLTKRAAAAELAALLALCAVSNNDRVGLLAFSSEVERYVPPNKGPRHVLRLLRDILAFDAKHPGTDLGAALDYLNKVQRRRAIVFLMSDFVGPDRPAQRNKDVPAGAVVGSYEAAFRRAARKHDLIAVRTSDPRERVWPAVGLVRLQDAETGRQVLVDTSSSRVRAEFAAAASARDEAFAKLARGSQADLIEAGTEGDHFDALLNFFRRRDRRRRRG
jgi:uncharacterized protein (DUF58 family)